MKTIRTQIRSASFVYYGLFLLYLATAIASPAQTFKTVHYFRSTRGANPQAALVQATNGNIYGTTSAGGANGHGGTVFQIDPNGKLITIYSFCSQPNCTDGSVPVAGLIQATNGFLYGTTADGGTTNDTCLIGCGTVFQIAPSGKLTTIHRFDGTDGFDPTADLIQATDKNLYGITWHGGANGNYGTVFRITPSGELTTIYTFCSQLNCTDGANPTERLIQATDGKLYGTTTVGGANGLGTVFNITLSGELTPLHSFDGTDGANPYAGLIQANNGKLYGTTYGTTINGGANINGTVFQITLSGELTTIHDFAGTDGTNPYADLIQATDGNLYGTTLRGGDNGLGTVFQITPNGKLKTIHSFDNRTDGTQPFGDLIQVNGKLYGTTYGGGAFGVGTIFSLSK